MEEQLKELVGLEPAPYLQLIEQQDKYYQDRIQLLSDAHEIFMSERSLSSLSGEERAIILGQKKQMAADAAYDVNLFGSPGGSGYVGGIISSGYPHLNEFFAAIPRKGRIDQQQYQSLVNLFIEGVAKAGCKIKPFVFFTRILSVVRPDTFVSDADNVLAKHARGLNVANPNKKFDKYWEEFLLAAHQMKPFNELVGDPENIHFAMLDGMAWSEIGTNSPSKKSSNMDVKKAALNQILYGPPGTGKTYNTINKSLEIVDPDFYHTHKDDRDALKTRFDELLKGNHIGFVTFHQSFSYEDFVEGLKAVTENGVFNYDVEPGIFKSICERASSSYDDTVSLDDFDTALFKIQELSENSENRLLLETVRGKQFEIDFAGGGTFKVFPYATESSDPKYVASVANVRKLYLTGSKNGIYNSSYVEGFLLYLKKHCGLKLNSGYESADKRDQQLFVLIIDEINRGNISNIFGELITLIEPSKRAGGKEALSVKLPYSKESFSVPANLHIIGTMNTADKSLAQLDIALRRRFQFEEMMTNYELLSKIPPVDGIDIEQMVRTINKRIELLYDREHTIGHSFFLPLEDTPSIELLADIFELQILPLLEEYFFEDWERVAMVLGDHLKTDESLRFVVEQFDASEVAQLMGEDWDQTGVQPYSRNNQALKTAAAYIGIYS